MKRAIRVLLAFGAAAMFLSPSARAGGLAYADPTGDATAIGETDFPRQSDPELDLVRVSWSTTADELIVTTSLAALGQPIASDGWAMAHYFEYEGLKLELLIQDLGTASTTVFGPDGVYLRPAGDSSIEYPCVCRFTVDTKRAEVTATAELHSIGSAAKSEDPRLPRPRPGSEFSDLRTTSYRVAGALLSADHAAAPEGAALVV